MSPPVVYGLLTSPPVRAVLLTARAANVKIEFKKCDLVSGEHLKEDYKKMNPAHTIPSFNDNGFIIWESRAIMTYLVDKYGGATAQHLYPKDPQKRAAIDNILHFDNGSLWASIRRAFFGPLLWGESAPQGAAESFRDKLVTLEKILTNSPYLAGSELSLADISVVSSLTIPYACDFCYDNYPRLEAWRAKVVKELPYYDEVTAEGLKFLRAKYQATWATLQPKLI